MKIGNDFTLSELTASDTAQRENIKNNPNREQRDNIVSLVEDVLQPVRDYFGTVIITSGFRNKELNEAVGGSPTSQHVTGEAADFYVQGEESYDVACWIRDNLEFHQLILYWNRGHVHVGYRRSGDNDQEVLHVTEDGDMKRGLG